MLSEGALGIRALAGTRQGAWAIREFEGRNGLNRQRTFVLFKNFHLQFLQALGRPPRVGRLAGTA